MEKCDFHCNKHYIAQFQRKSKYLFFKDELYPTYLIMYVDAETV